MAVKVKYQGISIGRGESGTTRTVAYYGSSDEINEFFSGLKISEGGSGERITEASMSQDSGSIWTCEVKYSNAQGNDSVAAPDTSYGKKSAQLSCGMLSMPLSKCRNYRANWDHYLAVGCAEGETVMGVPEWWESATDTILTADRRENYRWIKSESELADGMDANGRLWSTSCRPQKPGLESYDLATYQVTESANFPSAEQAGRMVAGRLNKITFPDQTFELTKKLGGNFKCDAASIAWNGKYWIATLTYTLSGNADGWDKDLYDTF